MIPEAHGLRRSFGKAYHYITRQRLGNSDSKWKRLISGSLTERSTTSSRNFAKTRKGSDEPLRFEWFLLFLNAFLISRCEFMSRIAAKKRGPRLLDSPLLKLWLESGLLPLNCAASERVMSSAIRTNCSPDQFPRSQLGTAWSVDSWPNAPSL